MSTPVVAAAAAEVSEPSSGDEGRLVPGSWQTEIGAILGSLGRLADLQIGIWLVGVKMVVMRIVLAASLSLLALMFVIIAVLFLYAGVFRVLTDVLEVPTAWALLIFAGAHAFMAGILVVTGLAILNRSGARENNLGGGI